jgi:hypothetical protein
MSILLLLIPFSKSLLTGSCKELLSADSAGPLK